MYAVTGVTGRVGGLLARCLLAERQEVRAVVRDPRKGTEWAALGCEVAIARMEDEEALTAAFNGAEAVFILPPPVFDPRPGYPEARGVIDAVVAALQTTKPARVVCLSTIGADATRDNLLSQRTLMEESVSRLHTTPATFLRPAWFLENASWDVAAARETGVIHSFLMPLERRFPMVSTQDVGRVAASLLQESWSGKRVVEIEGPRRVSPNDLAAAFTRTLGKPVRAEVVPRATWESLFRSQGMNNPLPRIRMLEGFNEGWIDFPYVGTRAVKGNVGVDEVVAALIHGESDQA